MSRRTSAKGLAEIETSPNERIVLEVSPEELDLLSMIREGEYESITIKPEQGKIEKLEASRTEEQSSKIIDLIRSGDYQDIEIKQRDKKIVHIKRTIKKTYGKQNGKQP